MDMVGQVVNMVGQRCGRGGTKLWNQNASSASGSRLTRPAVTKLLPFLSVRKEVCSIFPMLHYCLPSSKN